MPSPEQFKIGQHVRIIALDTIPPYDPCIDGDTGTITATLTIAPGYYLVKLTATDTRCIVFASNLEAVSGDLATNDSVPQADAESSDPPLLERTVGDSPTGHR